MIVGEYISEGRELNSERLNSDLVVIGGGMSGVCCAIAAAREGLKVTLVQDRPVLGGNASSEVRLWVLGATSHMGNNNRWSREGGVIDEILVENTFRNREGNPVFFDTVLLDKVLAEPNITLFLNTVVTSIRKEGAKRIKSVEGFNAQNSTRYQFNAPLYADCSGDGIVAYLSGASYRIGSESKDEFGELFTPDPLEYGEKLGHSILFYMKDLGRPVSYTAPDFAKKDVEKHIAKLQNPNYFNLNHHGCKYWWLEYGGRIDTVHDTEEIKQEIWSVIYGVWDYVKNSGKFPEADNLTLEWVGLIAGKRESRRFEGYTMLTQADVIEQREHYDAVAYGGWSIDLHPADGVYSPKNGCNQWHSKGIYQIPYRTLISPDIENLYLGGRLISASHVAFGSSRVMCTTAHCGQAIGVSAAICTERGLSTAQIKEDRHIVELQKRLIATGQYIPNLSFEDDGNLVRKARISASSQWQIDRLPHNDRYFTLDYPAAQLIPLKGTLPKIIIPVIAAKQTTLSVELRGSLKKGNFTPDVTHRTLSIDLKEGEQRVELNFDYSNQADEYLFICFMKNPDIAIATTDYLVTGLVSVFNFQNPAVSNYGNQQAPEGIGVDSFEFWCPQRRPQGQNFAIEFNPPLEFSSCEELKTDIYRPVSKPNGWIAAPQDENPSIELAWDSPQTINSITLYFDTDFDHAMENVQMGHYDGAMPHCVAEFCLEVNGEIVWQVKNNHQTVKNKFFDNPLVSSRLVIQLKKTHSNVPVSMMGVRVE